MCTKLRVFPVHSPGPYGPHLLWQTGHQQYEVGHGQTEQIVVGGRVHVFVFGDHHAGDRVADDAGDENHRVHDGHGHDDVQRISFGHHVVMAVGPRVFRARRTVQRAASSAAASAVASAVVQRHGHGRRYVLRKTSPIKTVMFYDFRVVDVSSIEI